MASSRTFPDLCVVTCTGEPQQLAIEPSIEVDGDEEVMTWAAVDDHIRRLPIDRVLKAGTPFRWRSRGRVLALSPLTVGAYNAMRSPGSRRISNLDELRRMLGLAA